MKLLQHLPVAVRVISVSEKRYLPCIITPRYMALRTVPSHKKSPVYYFRRMYQVTLNDPCRAVVKCKVYGA